MEPPQMNRLRHAAIIVLFFSLLLLVCVFLQSEAGARSQEVALLDRTAGLSPAIAWLYFRFPEGVYDSLPVRLWCVGLLPYLVVAFVLVMLSYRRLPGQRAAQPVSDMAIDQAVLPFPAQGPRWTWFSIGDVLRRCTALHGMNREDVLRFLRDRLSGPSVLDLTEAEVDSRLTALQRTIEKVIELREFEPENWPELTFNRLAALKRTGFTSARWFELEDGELRAIAVREETINRDWLEELLKSSLRINPRLMLEESRVKAVVERRGVLPENWPEIPPKVFRQLIADGFSVEKWQLLGSRWLWIPYREKSLTGHWLNRLLNAPPTPQRESAPEQ